MEQKARLTLYELHDNVDWLLLSTDSNEPHNIGVAILLQDPVGGVGEDTAARGQSIMGFSDPGKVDGSCKICSAEDQHMLLAPFRV